MKTLQISKKFMLAMALLLATTAFAAEKASLSFSQPTSVGGKVLSSGDYKAEWTGNGPDIQLNILKGKQVVATVPARLVDLDRPSSQTAAVTQTNADGSTSLTQLQFQGKKQVINLTGEPAQTAAANSGR